MKKRIARTILSLHLPTPAAATLALAVIRELPLAGAA
jgi:hypothetical protein